MHTRTQLKEGGKTSRKKSGQDHSEKGKKEWEQILLQGKNWGKT